MAMPRVPNLTSKRILWVVFSAIRALIAIALLAYFTIAVLEFSANREVMHLAMFSMFILCANFQLSIGAYETVMTKEGSAQIFMLAMFTMSATFLELTELALDQLLKQLSAANLPKYYWALNITETIVGIVAALIFCYSLDKFIVFLKAKTLELKNVAH